MRNVKPMVLHTKYGKQFIKAEDTARGIVFELFIKQPSFKVKWGKWNPNLKVCGARRSVDKRSYIVTVHVHPNYYINGDAFKSWIMSTQTVCTNVINTLFEL